MFRYVLRSRPLHNLKFEHFTSLSRRERQRNLSKCKTHAYRTIVLWHSRSRRLRPCLSCYCLTSIHFLAVLIRH